MAKKPKSKITKSAHDPFGLHSVANTCGVDPHFFSIVPESDGEHVELYTANREPIYHGSAKNTRLFLDGVIRGCIIAKTGGKRQREVLGGTKTKAPKVAATRAQGQVGLFGEKPSPQLPPPSPARTPPKGQRTL
jgi:hypothetical protein